MTFLSPALLALGLAAAVPVALHLLQRQPGPRLVFPALRYLRRAERDHATRLRLRQILLLALRVLALLLLAAAAARPFAATGGAEHHPTSVVIVLDNSLSSGTVVGDRRVLDHLKDVALSTRAAAGPEDRIWLIRAAQPWEAALTGSPETLAAAVRATEPLAAGAELPVQVERAGSILASEPPDRAREVHLLSDLTATSFQGGTGAEVGAPLIVLDPPTTPGPNRAVTAVEVGGGMAPRAGERSTVAVTVQAFAPRGGSPAADDSVDVRLVMEGTARAAARMPVGAVAVLPFPASGAGIVTGWVEVDGDALAADDRRHFAVRVRPPPMVALAAPAPFIEEAIGVLADAGRVRRSEVGAAEVVLAPGAVGADAVRRGAAVVVVPPATPLELAAANQRLSAAGIPWRFRAPPAGEARLDAVGSGLEAVLGDVRLRQAYGLDAVGQPADTVLLRTGTGALWAVAGDAGPGRYLILATPLTPEGGTIATSAAMVPLVDRAVTAWAPGAAEDTERRPGAVVSLPAGDSIVRPDGGRDLVDPGSPYRLTRAGVYRVFDAGAVVAAFAVNAPPEASDVRTVSAASAAARVAGGTGRTATARAWEASIFRERLGRDLTLVFLTLAILALLAEAGLAAAWRSARRATGDAATGQVATQSGGS